MANLNRKLGNAKVSSHESFFPGSLFNYFVLGGEGAIFFHLIFFKTAKDVTIRPIPIVIQTIKESRDSLLGNQKKRKISKSIFSPNLFQIVGNKS